MRLVPAATHGTLDRSRASTRCNAGIFTGITKVDSYQIQCYNQLILITTLQEGIELFRKQLAIILHESVLNEIKGTPEYYQPINSGDTSDVLMWDKTDPTPTEVSQASKGAKDPSPSSIVPKTPINKNELVSKLRNYIMSIDHDDSMK